MRRITKAGLARRASMYRAQTVSTARRIAGKTEAIAASAPDSPADFATWVKRTAGRRVAGFPDVWRASDVLDPAPATRVAVLLHVFYPELVPEILTQLASIPVPFDLVVTNATGGALTDLPGAGTTSAEGHASSLPLLRRIVVLEVDNHGRDILPMVSVVNAGLLDPYWLVLKIHTKRSPWRAGHALQGSGSEWRAELLNALLGSEQNVSEILAAFAESRDVGAVTADGSVLGPQMWGDNDTVTATLLRRLELELDRTTLSFPAGSMYWIRGFLLQGLRALNLSADDFEPEQGQVNATTAHAIERLVGVVAAEAGATVLERRELPKASDPQAFRRYDTEVVAPPRVEVVPFYLPQFHPVPENDRWWGRGFTEWSNVAIAQPVFLGHNQPRVPTDLGFYDLRLDSVRHDQASLAADAGIAGFMYYYYWFAGQRLLDLPISRHLTGDLELPFCIMWANENWTRRWDGRSKDILIGQHYDEVPAERFIDDVIEFLLDPRYLRVGGRPVLAVYRPGQVPDFTSVAKAWRQAARDAGVGEIFLLNVDVVREFDGLEGDSEDHGLDGSLGFPPHNSLWSWIPHAGLAVDRRFKGNLLSYQATARDAERKLAHGSSATFPGVMVNFDNTARRQWAGDVWFGSNPYTYRRWLAAAADAVSERDPDRRIVFVNAWNEWAEGATLEPDTRFGRSFLQATRDVALA